MTDAPARPAKPQAVLAVLDREHVSEHLVRLTIGGDGFDAYADNPSTDKYVKLLFADPAHGLTPPYDLETLRREAPEKLPARRTYTVRRADLEARTLEIDFVVHGDEGLAGPWARRAKPGDGVVLMGAGGGYAPDAEADWHLLVGDLTAVPAIGAAIERLPEGAVGEVVLEARREDAGELPAHPGLRVHWVEPRAGDPERDGESALVDAVRGLAWRDGAPHVFAHGERGAIKLLRRHLVGERRVPRERLSISAYWAKGRTEDVFQAEKREPIGRIDPEA